MACFSAAAGMQRVGCCGQMRQSTRELGRRPPIAATHRALVAVVHARDEAKGGLELHGVGARVAHRHRAPAFLAGGSGGGQQGAAAAAVGASGAGQWRRRESRGVYRCAASWPAFRTKQRNSLHTQPLTWGWRCLVLLQSSGLRRPAEPPRPGRPWLQGVGERAPLVSSGGGGGASYGARGASVPAKGQPGSAPGVLVSWAQRKEGSSELDGNAATSSRARGRPRSSSRYADQAARCCVCTRPRCEVHGEARLHLAAARQDDAGVFKLPPWPSLRAGWQ